MSHKFCLTFANIPFPPDEPGTSPEFDEHNPRCEHCGSTDVWLSHNTLSHYCLTCDTWTEEKETGR